MGSSVGRRVIGKLSALQVQKLKAPGHVGDGGGLWLQISSAGTKSWVFRFTLDGRSREMGLGPVHTISLALAREKAREARELLLQRIDPIEAKHAASSAAVVARAKDITFRVEADAYIESHRAGWKNAKHAEQWTNTLKTYAYPTLGDLYVRDIDTALVMKCLRPIWNSKTETASRVRGRIESVLDYATALKHRSGDNPARWKGHLDNLLPKPATVAKTEHHPALPYADAGGFMADLRAREGLSARALEFVILTACRTNEVLGAHWSEIDLDAAVWTVPAARMKAKREHRVPLSKAALKLLRGLPADKPYVFPSPIKEQPLSNMSMLQLLQKHMQRPSLTVHGFRSTFRDWAAETTSFPGEVVEMALAHTISDEVEAAYRRGDLLEKRAKLMEAWATYCGRVNTAATVTPIRAKKA